jgi:hypothetical protein
MRTYYLIMASLIGLATTAHAQKCEYSINLNTGLFRFKGKDAAIASYLVEKSDRSLNYTDKPFGTQQQTSYGVAGQLQYISKSKIIMGLQGGYDLLRSKVGLYQPQHIVYAVSLAYYNYPTPITGSTTSVNSYLNLNPFIGYRIVAKAFNIDLKPGLDVAFGLHSHEKGEALADDKTTVKTDLDRDKPVNDLRLRLDITAYFKNMGLTAGYSSGLNNLNSQANADVNDLHSQLLRFGLSFRL